MNDQIRELIDVIKAAKVNDVEGVINVLEGYFGSFLFHPLKKEWDQMNNEDRWTLAECLVKHTNSRNKI